MANHRRFTRAAGLTASIFFAAAALAAQPQTRSVTADDTLIQASATLTIDRASLPDPDGDGVIHIHGDNLTINLGGETLRGADPETPPDQMTGIGIVVSGRNITIRNGRVSGYKVGLLARECDGLVLDELSFEDNFRHKLASTRAREAGSDWLWPHHNDDNQWLQRYGAAVWIEDSDNVTVRNLRVREGQNGIVLDNVTGSRVYDNDASFLSGWGIAMWRATDNTITRNAFDFCIRGYSHGVYNRGQDSAGILMFEQCSGNLIAENSATHGGDGLFAFAGREALGESWRDAERERLRRETGEEDVEALIEPSQQTIDAHKGKGNNNNRFIGNDFSYAAAHGLELTFSFDNQILGNRFAGNAICGIWGGYSQNTTIRGNFFIANGDAGYGLERGGVNIEHGYGNRILGNLFRANKCGVHLWWDPDEGLMRLPWAIANERGSTENAIIGNIFELDDVAVHLRQCGETTIARNEMDEVGQELLVEDCGPISREAEKLQDAQWTYEALGETRPVGAREGLAGRASIIMTQWGPWDWQSPEVLFQGASVDDEGRPYLSYLLLGRTLPRLEVLGAARQGLIVERHDDPASEALVEVRIIATQPGLHTVSVRSEGTESGSQTESRELLAAAWEVKHFAYETDPREDVEAWRDEADDAVRSQHTRLDFAYAMGGPSADLPPDYFGTIAQTSIPLPPGEWRITTTSDDGVRVWVGDELIIDNWTWHAPTDDTGTFTTPLPGYEGERTSDVPLRVEHFELNGYAVLKLEIERVK